MTSEDLGEQDRAFLARVGAVPTNRKPVSVWLAQALCVVLGILTGLSAFQRQGYVDPPDARPGLAAWIRRPCQTLLY